MKNWERHELTTTPASADLILQIGFVGRQAGFPIRLVMVSPRTHVTLWPLTEHVQAWARGSTGRKNFDKGITALVADVRQLTSQSAPATNAVHP